MIKVQDLLTKRPRDIQNPTLVVMRRNGNPVAYAIDISDKDGKKYRLRVQTEAKAKNLLARALS
jgi:FixJ family two-component response regulator